MTRRLWWRRSRQSPLVQPNPGVRPLQPLESVVVVSPHFDDAVFSCWSVIVSDGAVDVVTVFSAGPADDRVTEWDSGTGVTSAERMVQRAHENDEALALAGRRATNLALLQAGYGGGAVPPDLLGAWLRHARRVYAPAGAGLEVSHPEHVVVRDACLAVRPDSVLYADNPYSGFRADVDLPRGLRGELERRVVELTPEQRARKAEAIRCYGGELPQLEAHFGAVADPDMLLFEVYWTPVSPDRRGVPSSRGTRAPRARG